MTRQRALRVVEVTALRLDCLACLARILFLPLRDDVKVSLHFEKVLENKRKALGRGLFEGQDLDVVVVELQVSAMAFQMRFAKVVIQKRVMFEPSKLDLLGREIQHPL